jgi:hypothetical protein
MSRGRMRVATYLYSHSAKIASSRMEEIIKTISYGVDHPTAGA